MAYIPVFPEEVQPGDAIIVTPTVLRAGEMIANYTFVTAPEIENLFKEGDMLLIAPPTATTSVSEGDSLAVDGMALFVRPLHGVPYNTVTDRRPLVHRTNLTPQAATTPSVPTVRIRTTR